MSIIKKPSAVDSPYVAPASTAPTRLASKPVAGGGVNTVAATVANTVSANANANTDTSSASTGSNVSYYTSGIEGIAGLASYGRVFDGANVYVTLEQPQYITYNQNYTGSGTVGGANGQVQFNDNGNFGGSANLTFDGANLTVGGKITGGQVSTTGNVIGANLFTAGRVSAIGNVSGNYFIGNGSQLTGINASSNKIFNGNSYANIANASGNLVISANGNAWTFGTNGNLTFPENSGDNWPINQQRFGMGNIGAWLDGQWTIGEFSGNGVSGEVGIRIDPAIEGYTGITLPGSASSNTQPVQIYSTNGGGIELYTGSNNWEFNADGTTTFPDNTLKIANNQTFTTRTQSSGNAYTITYQSSNSWEAYAEDDNTGSHAAYAWIKADLNTVETPRVFITNSKGSDGTELTWTFDAVGNLTLPTNTSSINYANGQPYGGSGSGAANKIFNGASSANIEFPSGNLAVGINLQPVGGVWIDTYGNIIVTGSGDTIGSSVIVDEGGNVYVTGTLNNVDFDAQQAFVRKLSSTGNVLWQKGLPQSVYSSGYSSGESLAIDGAGNIYWVSNLYGGELTTSGSPVVAKLNPTTGAATWTTLVTGGAYAQDITVSGAGQVFITCDNGARITSLSSAGAVLWSFDPTATGTSLLDLGTFVLVGYQNGNVAAYDYSGNLLWNNQVFDVGAAVFGLASDGTDWYAANANGYIMKISGADNSTILWQRHINREGTGGNLFTTWIEYSDGSLYVGGTGNDGSSDSLITVKINATDGSLIWARALEANTASQWYWYGHHDLSISGAYYLITGYAIPNDVGANDQVLARLPIDGSLAGSTVGPYKYVTVPALTVDVSDVAGEGYSTPSQPDAVTTTSNTTLNALVAPYTQVNILSPFTTGPLWTFGSDGNLTVPAGGINAITDDNLSLNVYNNGDTPAIALYNWVANGAYPTTYLGVNTNSVEIVSNIAGTAQAWTFNSNGTLALPNGAVIKDTPGDSVAFGQNAGFSGQNQHSVAIGPNAGEFNQGEDSVAIGYNAATGDQGQRAIAIGWGAGATSQQIWGQAYGQDAGGYHQTSGAIAMGLSAGLNLQSQEAIAIGTNAAYGGGEGKTVFNMQNANTVRLYTSNNNLYPGMKVVGGSIGATSGIVVTGIIGGEDVSLSSDVSLNNGDNLIFYNQQGAQAVAVGSYSGEFLQGQHAVAVGYRAGQTRQGYAAVSVGEDSGNTQQGLSAVAIGRTAGQNYQGNSAIAMGWNAGQETQGNSAVAIGEDAGRFNQGQYSIAIGRTAGYNLQANNSIILNATGVHVNTITANSFTVAPVRASTLNNYSLDTGNVLYYNTSTNEVTTAPLNNITGDPFAANIYDSTSNVTLWTASSDEVVGAKLTVRVVYATSGWQNTEMLDIMIAKNYPDGTPAFTVSNRVKTNPAYSDTLIDVTLTGGNVLQVISSAPSGAGNNVYWTCSATSFNQTLD